MKNLSSNQLIIDCLKTYYNIEVTTLSFLPLGADMNAAVYKAETQGELAYFVKLKQGSAHDNSHGLLDLFHHAKIQEVIPPIKTTQGRPTQPMDDFTIILYPFIEGQNGFSLSLTAEQWFTLGKTLRQIHEMKVPLSIKRCLRQETYSSKWREAVKLFYSEIEKKSGDDEIGIKFLNYMKKNKIKILRLVDRAEQLAKKLQDETFKFVLCHSDIHGGNILIDKKNHIYIVDWDDPIMAPKERDLMFIGGGVGNVWNNSHEEAFFYKGYGKTEINKTTLAYYRHERIVEDIALFSQSLLSTAEGKQKEYKHFMDMFKPRGVVDIAFATAEN